MPKRLSLIIGIVLAILAVALTKFYLERQRRSIEIQTKRALVQMQQNQSAVLVAKQDIPQGALLDSAMLETVVVPNQHIPPQAVTSLGSIVGTVVTAPIAKGEPITSAKLMRKQQRPTGSLAMATPMGKRAITIPVDNISSVGGMIKPGDYVDVLGRIPSPVQTPDGKMVTQEAVVPFIQHVLVLAVGQELGTPEAGRVQQRKKKEATSPIITLALSPQEASLIAFVQEQGKIRLILRSPADSQIQPVQAASWESLLQHLNLTPQEAKKKDEEVESEPRGTIEIYRGLKKETIPLSK